MNSEDIRKANELCQKLAQETKDVSQHEAALESLKASMLTEIAAQLSEVGLYLKRLAYPMQIVGAGGRIEDFRPTLRDQFAMAAMQMIANADEFWVSDGDLPKAAKQAYKWADVMLEARQK